MRVVALPDRALGMKSTVNEYINGGATATESTARLFVFLPALILLVVGGLIQSQTYLNHDVAWVLDSSERLLAGGTFGQDIVAANPPLIWWISAIVAAMANGLGLDPLVMLRLCVIGLSAIVLVVLERGLREQMERPAMAGFLAVLALLFTVGVHRDFAQREHMAVLLCLPWLVVTSARAQGHAQPPVAALAAGLAAGIGIAFKPHFLAVLLLVWGYLAYSRRSIRPVLSMETFVLLLTGIGYLVAVWLFARPYITDIMPLISKVYWGFSYPLENVARAHILEISLVLAALIVAFAFDAHHASRLTVLAALGFLVAAFAQSKGYSYHFYPVLAFAIISLALSSLTNGRAARRMAGMVPLFAGLVLSSLQAAPMLAYRGMNGAYGQLTSCLVDLTQANVSVNGGFMAISTHPYPGFPVTNYSNRRWVAATNSRLFMPAIVRLRELPALTPAQDETLAVAQAAERAAILSDLSRNPELVLVDARKHRHAIEHSQIDFLAFYGEDPAFARRWQDYQEIESCAPGIRAFTRSNGH